MGFYHALGAGTAAKYPPPSTPPRSVASPAPSSSHRQRSVVKPCQDSGSDSEWNSPVAKLDKHRRFRWSPSSGGNTTASSSMPFGRAVAVAAFGSSVVAVLISLFAVWFFYSSTVMDLYSDQQLITTTSVVRTRYRSPPQSPQSTSASANGAYVRESNRDDLLHYHQKTGPQQLASLPILLSHMVEEDDQGHQHHQLSSQDETIQRHQSTPTFRLPLTKLEGANATSHHYAPNNHVPFESEEAMNLGTMHQDDEEGDDDGVHPHVAWLMSFPNSGTSFTIHMTREATNCTTATNYALEGEIRDKPSVPAIAGEAGSQGPWLELIPYKETSMPKRLILTKTHCSGFCTGRLCGPDKTILTLRSFKIGCLKGTRAVATRRGLEKKDVTYSPSLVRKAIHIFRHPLDNIVARFHLEYNVQALGGNHRYAQKFPKNATGFRSWCSKEDENRGLLRSRLLDKHLRRQLAKIPCFNDFFRYLQWHNLAFSLSHDMDLPTLVLHYHEYADNYGAARDRVLEFLELPRTGDGIPFEEGKVYRDYYSNHQKKAIRAFLREFASSETWEQLEGYDFEIDE